MDEVSSADGQACIPGGGLNKDVFERCLIKNFPVGDAIKGHAAREANRLLARPGVQRTKHIEQNFFETRLQGRGAVAMYFLNGRRRIAGRSQTFGHVIREHRAQLGSFAGIAPGHFGAGAMMLEVFKAQAEAEASIAANDAAKLIEVGRFTVGGEPHDFEFITEFAESKILRNSGVIHAQRMGKGNRSRDAHAISLSGSPHGAGEISQAIRGQQSSLIEWRNKKRACQMRLVMLDAMELCSNLFW